SRPRHALAAAAGGTSGAIDRSRRDLADTVHRRIDHAHRGGCARTDRVLAGRTRRRGRVDDRRRHLAAAGVSRRQRSHRRPRHRRGERHGHDGRRADVPHHRRRQELAAAVIAYASVMPTTYPNLIDGQAIASADANVDINPSNVNDIVGEFARGTSSDVDKAIASARAAFKKWSRSTPQERFDVLDRAGTEILARKDELGRLLSREQGKPLADGIGEAARAGAIFKFFAGEALRGGGDKIDSVTPGNFPLAIPAWKIAPALAFGNTVVFKPAELVPASPWTLADIVQRAGLPPGVLNLVMGPGAKLGAALAASADVDAVTFTGSQDVGPSVAASAVKTGARVQLEMGGK